MTSPSDPQQPSPEGREVDLTKRGTGSGDPTADAPFDPYRFGRPEHPVPPEYAPPGYVAPPNQPTGSPQYGPPGNPYQRGPYPPYGAPPAPPFHGYAQPGTTSGKAVTALVCGILSILLCWLSFFDIVPVALGVVFGVLALVEINRRGGRGKGMAVTGLVCTAIGAVLAIVLTVLYVHVASQCGGLVNGANDPNFQQCIQNHL